MSVISSVAPDLAALGLDAHPHPAALATTLCMPKPTVTVVVKRLEAAAAPYPA